MIKKFVLFFQTQLVLDLDFLFIFKHFQTQYV